MDYCIFDNLEIKLKDIIFILYYYFQEDISYNKVLYELCLTSKATVLKILQKLRNVTCKWGEELNKRKIGGPGKIIEVDESCIYKRKNVRTTVDIWGYLQE